MASTSVTYQNADEDDKQNDTDDNDCNQSRIVLTDVVIQVHAVPTNISLSC